MSEETGRFETLRHCRETVADAGVLQPQSKERQGLLAGNHQSQEPEEGRKILPQGLRKEPGPAAPRSQASGLQTGREPISVV